MADSVPDWVEDEICNALMATHHGKYDGKTVEVHLEGLLKRVRAANLEADQ